MSNNLQSKKIKDFASVNMGGTPSRNVSSYWGGDIKWMSSGEINKKRIFEVSERITQEGFENSNVKLFPPKTIMMAMNGQGKTRATVAILETETTCNQSLAGIIPNKVEAFPYYLYYSLEHKYKEIRNITGDGGRNGLNLKIIRDLKVLLPPVEEQQKIAAILSSVDDAIDKTEQIIEQTERVKQGLMQQLLTKGIGHTEFKQTEIGEIPKGWSLLTLGECSISKPEYGSTASAKEYNENLPRYIRITDISSNGSLNYNDVKSVQITGNEKYLLKENDVLFARTGNTVGKTYLHKKEDPSVFAGYLIRFRLDQNKILPEYLFHLTHSTYYYNWVLSVTRTGAQPNINAKEYSSFMLPSPPMNEQRKIVSIIESIFHKAENERQKSLNLQRLKRGLMQQLLTGKVRVPVDENEVMSQ